MEVELNLYQFQNLHLGPNKHFFVIERGSYHEGTKFVCSYVPTISLTYLFVCFIFVYSLSKAGAGGVSCSRPNLRHGVVSLTQKIFSPQCLSSHKCVNGFQ